MRVCKRIKDAPALRASGVTMRAFGDGDIEHKGVAHVTV